MKIPCIASAIMLIASLAAGTESGSMGEPRPQGFGLSAKYPGDAGLKSDPAVLLYEDFETGNTPRDVAKRNIWTSHKNPDGKALAFSDIVPEQSRGKRSIAITATRGANSGGYYFCTFKKGQDQLFARFYVRFAEDAGYTHHFSGFTATSDPQPWPMGKAGIKPTGRDRFNTGLEPNGGWGNVPPPGNWVFYTYWQNMQSKWGSLFPQAKPKPIVRGKWMCMELMMKANSAPDKSDGIQAFWIDGKLAGWWGPGGDKGKWNRGTWRPGGGEHYPGFRWRATNSLKINQFKLELYVSGRVFQQSEKWAKKYSNLIINTQKLTCNFDDVVVATQYIGPIAPVGSKTATRKKSSSQSKIAARQADPLAVHKEKIAAAERLAREGSWSEAAKAYRAVAEAAQDETVKSNIQIRLQGIQARSALIRTIVKGLSAQGKKHVYIDFAGQAQRARLVKATETEGTYSLQGSRIPLGWNQISGKRLAGIAAKYADKPEQQLAIARFLAACGEKEAARNQIDKLLAAAPTGDAARAAKEMGRALR